MILMSDQTNAKTYTCAHNVLLDRWCWMCDYENNSTIRFNENPRPTISSEFIKTNKNIPEQKVPIQMSLLDIIKEDHVPFMSTIKFTPKGPVEKSTLPSFIKTKDNQEDHLFHITPKVVSFHLDGYAVVPFEEWKALDKPLFHFINKVINFFKRTTDLEDLG